MRLRLFAAAVTLAGCAAGSDAAVSAGDPGEIVGAPPSASAPSPYANAVARNDEPANGTTTTHAFNCRPDAFCDDFESADPSSRWTASSSTAATLIDFVGPSASPGSQSLRVRTEGGVGAWLERDGGTKASHWAGALGFALRLDALPADRLAGPRLVVTRPEGEASIGIAVTSEGLVLEQTADGKTTTNVVAAATPNAWTRIILGVETNEAASAPYGRLEVAVDDDDLQVYAVMVPVHTGALTVRAGVVEAPSAYATTQIDDVMFFAH